MGHMLSWSKPYFSNLFWYKLGICCLGPYCIFKICFLVQARHTLSWSILYFWNLLVQVRHTLSWSILYFWNLLVQVRHMLSWSILYFFSNLFSGTSSAQTVFDLWLADALLARCQPDNLKQCDSTLKKPKLFNHAHKQDMKTSSCAVSTVVYVLVLLCQSISVEVG